MVGLHLVLRGSDLTPFNYSYLLPDVVCRCTVGEGLQHHFVVLHYGRSEQMVKEFMNRLKSSFPLMVQAVTEFRSNDFYAMKVLKEQMMQQLHASQWTVERSLQAFHSVNSALAFFMAQVRVFRTNGCLVSPS